MYEIYADTGDTAEAPDFGGARLAALSLLTDADATTVGVFDGEAYVGRAAYCNETGQPCWYGSTLDRARR